MLSTTLKRFMIGGTNLASIQVDEHYCDPRRKIRDPAVFEVESKGLLTKTWQFAGHVSAIAKPGDYFTFEMAGESLFCIRDRDGNIGCFYNVCQHRAHQLLEGEATKLIVCPYHARLRAGWPFRQ